MRIKNWSFLYSLGYVIVFHGIRGFYKKFQVVGRENIPKDKPVIFASNHQNAFMDPIVIAVHLKKPVYYMVRADIFKKPAVAKILASLNMLAIYRQRDGGNTIEKNKAVFDNCYDLLQKKSPIIIFVEGNQGKQKNLRQIQKGIFRIGLGAENKHNNELDVQIIPIGLYYSDTVNMGSKMLINFGKPIKLQNYIQQHKENEAITVNKLKDVLSGKMSEVMIDIKDGDYYDTIHEIMFAFEKDIFEKEGIKKASLLEEFNAQKSYISKISKWIEANPEEAKTLKSNVEPFKKGIQKNELKAWLFNKEKHSIFLAFFGLVIAFPIHLYGMINNYIPYKLPTIFVENKVKDIHFHSSIKMAMGAIFFGGFWTIQCLVFALFTDDYLWLWYFASLPLSAWFSYEYWISFLKTKGKLRYNKMNKKSSSEFRQLKNERRVIKDTLEKVYG